MVEAKIVTITVNSNENRLYEVDYYDGEILLCSDELESGPIGPAFEVKDIIRNKCEELQDFVDRQGVADVKQDDTISATSFAKKVETETT